MYTQRRPVHACACVCSAWPNAGRTGGNKGERSPSLLNSPLPIRHGQDDHQNSCRRHERGKKVCLSSRPPSRTWWHRCVCVWTCAQCQRPEGSSHSKESQHQQEISLCSDLQAASCCDVNCDSKKMLMLVYYDLEQTKKSLGFLENFEREKPSCACGVCCPKNRPFHLLLLSDGS